MNNLIEYLKHFIPKNLSDLIRLIILLVAIIGFTVLGSYFFSIRYLPDVTIDQWLPIISGVFFGICLITCALFGIIFLIGFFFKDAFIRKKNEFEFSKQARQFIAYFLVSVVVYYGAICTMITIYHKHLEQLTYNYIILASPILIYPYFLLLNAIFLKKLNHRGLKIRNINYVACNFFIISLLAFLFTLFCILLTAEYTEYEKLLIFPILQILPIVCGFAFIADRKKWGKNIFISSCFLVYTFFLFGATDRIIALTMRNINIRKEHVDIILPSQSCTRAAHLLHCEHPIMPKVGYCQLSDIVAPSVIGPRHLVDIPIKKFVALVQCPLPPYKKEITDKSMLKFEVSRDEIQYTEIIEEK